MVGLEMVGVEMVGLESTQEALGQTSASKTALALEDKVRRGRK